ncbi:MAG: hypothetical protein MI799_00680, partial [Desulfobacterales bacterium]|nr:hypothetical protein [Desulfobacterales bacterium]
MDRVTQKIKAGPQISRDSDFQVSMILYVCGPYNLPGLKSDICPSPRKITWAVSMDEAATLVQKVSFDLVFIEIGALDDGTGTTVQQLKSLCPGLQVIFLVPPCHCKSRSLDQDADHMFIWSGTPELFHAMVRFIEDQICKDTTRRAVLLVEDSLEYASFFLPEVYKAIDSAFPGIRRPRLVLAGSYETAMQRFRELGSRLDCVLSDTRLPRNGEESPWAGVDILTAVHREMPCLPIMLMSAESVNKIKAQAIPAPFLDKNADQPARNLHAFFRKRVPNRPAPERTAYPKDRYPVRTGPVGFTRIGKGAAGG